VSGDVSQLGDFRRPRIGALVPALSPAHPAAIRIAMDANEREREEAASCRVALFSAVGFPRGHSCAALIRTHRSIDLAAREDPRQRGRELAEDLCHLAATFGEGTRNRRSRLRSDLLSLCLSLSLSFLFLSPSSPSFFLSPASGCYQVRSRGRALFQTATGEQGRGAATARGINTSVLVVVEGEDCRNEGEETGDWVGYEERGISPVVPATRVGGLMLRKRNERKGCYALPATWGCSGGGGDQGETTRRAERQLVGLADRQVLGNDCYRRRSKDEYSILENRVRKAT